MPLAAALREAPGPLSVTLKSSVSSSSRTAMRTRTGSCDTLLLSVTDNGPGASRNLAASGIGLGNLRERLALLFGERVRLESGPIEAGYRTRLGLPIASLTTAPSN